MRKWIIAAVVAVALFSIGAFAASFTLTADNISSGAAPVGTSCGGPFNVTWTVNTPADAVTPPTTTNYTVSGATITATGCTNQKYELAVQGAGATEVHCTGTLSGGTATFLFSGAGCTGVPVGGLKVSDTVGAGLFIGDNPVTIT